jgi:hypothetical protein
LPNIVRNVTLNPLNSVTKVSPTSLTIEGIADHFSKVSQLRQTAFALWFGGGKSKGSRKKHREMEALRADSYVVAESYDPQRLTVARSVSE